MAAPGERRWRKPARAPARNVTLWEFDAGNAEHLASKRESRFLPGVRLDDGIKVTRALAEAARADAILLVVPAQAMRSVVKSLAQTIDAGTPVIACAKGIEHGTHKFMTEIIAECAPKAVPAILSGPSFAADVARGLPTAVTLAAADGKLAAALAHAIEFGHLPPLSFDRRARRRDRRRRQERAGDRRRHRHRPRPRRQRRRRR